MERKELPLVLGAAVLAVASVAAVQLPNDSVYTVTLANLPFDKMLHDARYDKWFRTHVRCTQKAFRILCARFRIVLGEFDVERSIKRHSFEKKIAVLMFLSGRKVAIARPPKLLALASHGLSSSFQCFMVALGNRPICQASSVSNGVEHY
ncbi:TPA: hypothetical protein N0F65_004660 [Lagenidium giganteum]|uniref:Uncharacterized protein n=1 Tax=Lagenidium giganteum TaxID=4803 RepID=A0AAV2Z8V8_9STRA|nr:TPA: hypothetical protein N0F65_004660 [Lagenidium giganteum]